MAAAFFAQCILILSFFALAQRYTTDLYPFLIFCLLVFLRTGGLVLIRTRYLLIGLVIFSMVINSLTTISWLIGADQNVTVETRTVWSAFFEARFAWPMMHPTPIFRFAAEPVVILESETEITRPCEDSRVDSK